MVKIRSFNAVRAKQFGYKVTGEQKLIMMRSKPQVHTELEFSPRLSSLSFSATKMDGENGTRFKNIEYSHPERWDTIIIPTTDEQEDAMFLKAHSMLGIKYDLFGLLSFASPLAIIKPDKNKVWCSEADNIVLTDVLLDWGQFLKDLKLPVELNPAQLDLYARHYWREYQCAT